MSYQRNQPTSAEGNSGMGQQPHDRSTDGSMSLSLSLPGTQSAHSRSGRPTVPSREGRRPLNVFGAAQQVSSNSGNTGSFGRNPNDSGPRELGPDGQSIHDSRSGLSILEELNQEFSSTVDKSLPSNVAGDDSLGLLGRGNDQLSMTSVHPLAESVYEIKMREDEPGHAGDYVYGNSPIGVQHPRVSRPESLPVIQESTPTSSQGKTYTGSDGSVVQRTFMASNPKTPPVPAPRHSSSGNSLSNPPRAPPVRHSQSEPGAQHNFNDQIRTSGGVSAGKSAERPVFYAGTSASRSAGATPIDPTVPLRNIMAEKLVPTSTAPGVVGVERDAAGWGTGRERVPLTEVLSGQDVRPKEPRYKHPPAVQNTGRSAVPASPVIDKKPDTITEEEAASRYQLSLQKASLLEKSGKLEEAVAEAQMALYYNIQARGERDVKVAETHRALARLFRSLNKHQECVEHLETALDIYNHCDYSVDSDDLWSTHDELARAYLHLDRDKEIQHYERAIEILKLSTDIPPERLAHMHNNVGASYHRKQDYVKAESHLTAAKEMMEVMESNKVDLAKVYKGLGGVFMDTGQDNEAIAAFEKVLSLCNQSSQDETARTLSAQANGALAKLYRKVGDPRRSQLDDSDYEVPIAGEQVRQAVVDTPSPVEQEAGQLVAMAQRFQNEEKHQNALEYYQQALTMYQSLPPERSSNEQVQSKMAAIHNNMGNAYRSMSRFGEAKEALAKALAVRRSLYGDKPNEETASSLFNLGYICSQSDAIGDQVQAIELHKEALVMYDMLGGAVVHQKWMVALYRSLASNHYRLQNAAQSIEYYELAKQVINDHGGDLVQLQAIANNVGNSYKQLQRYDKAEENLKMALELASVLSDADPHNHELKNDIATSENNLGCLYQDMSLYDKAIVHHSNSLRIREQIKHEYVEAAVDIPCSLHNLGNACFSAGSYNDAIEYYQREEEVRRNLGDDPREAMLALSRVYERMGRLDEATASIDRATNF